MAKQYYRLSTKTTDGKSQILVRFKDGRKCDMRAKTPIFVEREYWDDDAQDIIVPAIRIKTPERIAREEMLKDCKKKLKSIKERIWQKYEDAQASNTPYYDKWLDDAINYTADTGKPMAEKNDFFDAFADYIDSADIAAHRRTQYRALWRCIKRFSLYEGLTLTMKNFTAETLDNLKEWLRDEYLLIDEKKYQSALKEVPESRLPKARGRNTVIGIMSMLRAFFNDAYSRNDTPARYNPFYGYKVGSETYTDPFFLNWDEVEALYKFDFSFNENLERQRDIFVFHCCVGCRVGDLVTLRLDNIVDDVLCYIPAKTRKERAEKVEVPLTNMAKEIILKYEGCPGGKLLPFTTTQKYNDDIKTVLSVAGINRMVTVKNPTTDGLEHQPICLVASTHMARRTFVGNMYRIVPDPNIIGKMTGHKEGSKAFARYRNIDNSIKKKFIEGLNNWSK